MKERGKGVGEEGGDVSHPCCVSTIAHQREGRGVCYFSKFTNKKKSYFLGGGGGQGN